MISFLNYWLGKADLLKCRKCSRLRTLMDSPHFNGSETLLKSARQYFYYIFCSLWMKINTKNSFLEACEILRPFVNTLKTVDKYSLSVKASVWSNQFICNCLKVKKNFLIFFSISRIYKTFRILSKKSWASEAISFWNYWLGKAELLKCAKNPRVRTFMENQHIKGSETLLKSARQYFCYIFWSHLKKIIQKNCFLEVSEILCLFVNIASEGISFWNYTLEKVELLKCPKSQVSEHWWTVNIFKASQTLLKSTRQYICDILWSFWKKIIPKNSFLEVSETLRLFLNILTPDKNYSLSVKASF